MLGDYLERGCFSANKLTNLTVGKGPWQNKGSLESKVLLDLRGHQNSLMGLISGKAGGTGVGSGLVSCPRVQGRVGAGAGLGS